jgi:hypothetical protein
MARVVAFASLVAILSGVAAGQAVGVLHIKVTVVDASRGPIPVPRHALLISDNPSTSAPRRVVTAADGTATVRLTAGNYTVESDEPVTSNGKSYQWSQTLDVAAGQDIVLELNAANAEADAPPATTAPGENDWRLLLPQWQDSVVALWTAESRASGFVVDQSGLVVTAQRLIGTATTVEVQLSPSIKVAARVLVADRARDVAILWIDPAVVKGVQPIPLGCAADSTPALVDKQTLVAMGAPLGIPKEESPGHVVRLDPRTIVADFRLAETSLGGPVFSTGGTLVGLSSTLDGQDDRRSLDARVVTIDGACEVMKTARQAMQAATRPAATHLPVESLKPFPADALAAAIDKRRAGSLSPYQMSAADFDIAFITPVILAGQQQRASAGRVNPMADFGAWSEYFIDGLPVLAVRVTPKMAESFWATLARGAAYTQGMALPPIKHFKPGVSQFRVYCGAAEVTPIHRFILEQRVSETDAVREGVFVFDPGALGPHCRPLKFVLSSEKEPRKMDSPVVDPAILEQIWQDFAPWRAQPQK